MRALAALVLASLLPSCVFFGGDDDSCAQQACTAIFAAVTVDIVDANGQHVSGMTTRTVSTVTGQVLHESSANDVFEYVVVDDSLDLGRLGQGERHAVQFTATGSAGTATADFVIAAGACICHVDKISGPDSIVVE